MWRATRKSKFILIFLSLLLAAVGVQAQTELVDNGDFETGTFANWTTSYTGGAEYYCYTDWVIESDDTDCIQPYFGPLAGNYSAVNSFDGPAWSEFHLYQDITIPVGSTADLSFMYRVQYYNDEVFPWTIARPFYVQVRDPDNNAILATLYTYLTNVPSDCCGTRESPVDNITKFDTGLVNVGPLDMSAWSGQTVRLYFFEQVPEFFTGGAVLSLDNISVLGNPLITLSETDGSTTVTEGGTTDTFTLSLRQAATDPVTIDLVPDAQCTVDVNPVVFAAGNVGPIAVTVTAVDDAVDEGAHSCMIQTNAAVSADVNFNGLNPADVVVNVQDNDAVIHPVDAAPQRNVVVAENSLLTWGPITWATAYEVQIDNDTNFSSPAYTDAALAVNGLTVPDLAAGLYYWRVRAQRSNGSWSGWSMVDQFVVTAPAP